MGRATAHLFADEGARLAIVDINVDSLQAVAQEIRDAGGDVRAWAIDIVDGDAIVAVVKEAVEHFGGLDILVNNAGVSLPTPIDGDDYETRWAMTLQVNLTAHTRFIRAALPYLDAADYLLTDGMMDHVKQDDDYDWEDDSTHIDNKFNGALDDLSRLKKEREEYWEKAKKAEAKAKREAKKAAKAAA